MVTMGQIMWMLLFVLVGTTSLLDGLRTTHSDVHQAVPEDLPTTIYTHLNEITIQKSHLVTTLHAFGKQYSVSFEVKPTKFLKVWANIIHFSQGGNMAAYGDRTPAVYFWPDKPLLGIASAVNGQYSYWRNSPTTSKQGAWIAVKIEQFRSGSVYHYQLYINNKMIFSTINYRPEEFKTVKVYVGCPWNEAQPGVIRNLTIEERRPPPKLSLTGSTVISSSIYRGYLRQSMVDGNFNTWLDTSGTSDPKPWVALTLNTEASIDEIRFYIAASTYHLANSVVTIGGKSATKAYGSLNLGEEFQYGLYQFYRINCRGAKGYFIKLQKQDDYYISIAEMELFGVYTM